MTRNDPRTWIWMFVIVEFVGLGVDALWHGVLHRDFEPGTLREMVSHLATVHLPLYAGVLGLLGSTTWALLARVKRGKAGIALSLAVMGRRYKRLAKRGMRTRISCSGRTHFPSSSVS